MRSFSEYLDYIDSRRSIIRELLIAWSNINSFSYNTIGLNEMINVLENAFRPFDQKMEKIELGFHQPYDSTENSEKLPLGRALRVRKRLTAKPHVLLCCHMDTVFPPDHLFQKCTHLG